MGRFRDRSNAYGEHLSECAAARSWPGLRVLCTDDALTPPSIQQAGGSGEGTQLSALLNRTAGRRSVDGHTPASHIDSRSSGERRCRCTNRPFFASRTPDHRESVIECGRSQGRYGVAFGKEGKSLPDRGVVEYCLRGFRSLFWKCLNHMESELCGCKRCIGAGRLCE